MTRANAIAIASNMAAADPRDAFLILRGTGMRPGECFAMQWEYVCWDGMFYQNPRGKTKTARRPIPLLGDAFSILQRRHAAQHTPKSGWIFPQDKSATGHIVSITKAFTKARDAAGLPKEMVLYTARHGNMTDLSGTCSLVEVMAIGGHSDVKTAMKYQHPDVAALKAKLVAAQPASNQIN